MYSYNPSQTRSRRWILWPFILFLLLLSIHFSALVRKSVSADNELPTAAATNFAPSTPTATRDDPPHRPTETHTPTVVIDTPTPVPTSTIAPTSTLAPTSTPGLEPGATQVSPVDGMLQIYVPAGKFYMGTSGGPNDRVNQPMHRVSLDAYWIGQTPVTNGMYSRCVEAGVCGKPIRKELNPHYYDPAYANHPVVYISWSLADQYCQWSGGRLPTEAEWEKAARGTDKRMYPWGNTEPNANRVNAANYHQTTVKVGRYPNAASPYGVLDMGSNVREWIADWYREDYPSGDVENPTGPSKGRDKVLRGASWFDPLDYVQVTTRLFHPPNSAGWNRGFRCVYDP